MYTLDIISSNIIIIKKQNTYQNYMSIVVYCRLIDCRLFYYFDIVLCNAFIAYKLLKGPLAGRKALFTTFRKDIAIETLRQYNRNKVQRVQPAPNLVKHTASVMYT